MIKSNLKGMVDRFKLKVGQQVEKGSASLSCYKYSSNNDPIYNMRNVRDGNEFMWMFDGVYVRLHINGSLYMSDTNMERMTNEEFIAAAHGKVLIAGLGIGLVLENLLEKVKAKVITEIVVVENNKDVIDLVLPYFKNEKALMQVLTVKQADIFGYHCNEKYDTIYFDIWESINTENLVEMNKLEKMFKPNLNKTDSAWMGCWLRPILKRMKAREQRESRFY